MRVTVFPVKLVLQQQSLQKKIFGNSPTPDKHTPLLTLKIIKLIFFLHIFILFKNLTLKIYSYIFLKMFVHQTFFFIFQNFQTCFVGSSS